jgi:hypothetical protein
VFYKISVTIDHGLDDLLVGILAEVYGVEADSQDKEGGTPWTGV